MPKTDGLSCFLPLDAGREHATETIVQRLLACAVRVGDADRLEQTVVMLDVGDAAVGVFDLDDLTLVRVMGQRAFVLGLGQAPGVQAIEVLGVEVARKLATD